MNDKKVKEKLLYQNIFRYLSERPYSLDADKEWKMSIHQKSSQLFITMRGKYGAEDR